MNSDNISQEEEVIIEQLYNQYERIVQEFLISNLDNDVTKAIVFWVELITDMMKILELVELEGSSKKEIIIKTICLIIRNEDTIDEEQKNDTLNAFLFFCPLIIELIIDVTKNVNIKKCLSFFCCRN